ncbi:MAG: M48 family metallopeptidase [Alphaproteobacteria bacterium]|nr:M48 family metallopeptidase [Alphaproteobacteria bacterium]
MLLLAAFPFLLLLILAILAYGFAWVLAGPRGLVEPGSFAAYGLQPAGGYAPGDFALAAIYAWWPYVVGGAAAWVGIGYLFNDSMIHAATGAQPLDRTQAPRLYAILEPLCISRGLAVPKLYIMDTDAMNAFASGIDQRTYSITVTRGLYERLDDRELEAVLAHELTHIINRDVRLMIVTVVFVGMLSFLAQMLWQSMRFGTYGVGYGRDSRERSKFVLFELVAAIIAAIGYVLALVLRFAISRKREYLADAGSLELTKNPEALISALRKISANPEVPHVPSEVKQMFIENPPHLDFVELFATHPPIEARIKVLEQLGGVHPGPVAPRARDPSTGPWGPHEKPPQDDRGPWGPHKH